MRFSFFRKYKIYKRTVIVEYPKKTKDNKFHWNADCWTPIRFLIYGCIFISATSILLLTTIDCIELVNKKLNQIISKMEYRKIAREKVKEKR